MMYNLYIFGNQYYTNEKRKKKNKQKTKNLK